ncbi:DUF2141 domain-containing protein [Acuticoccus sediminis]|nr:DUF2141 domain-containing protein [Acuticoccus sediminis]
MNRLRALPIALVVAGAVAAPCAAMAADVTITVDGIQPGTGNILVALQTEDEFLSGEGTYSAEVPADADTLTTVLEGVVPGEYAVAVVHDENGDGTFALGDDAPLEPWGVSGDQLGDPTFESSKIVVSEDGDNKVTVTIAYPM